MNNRRQLQHRTERQVKRAQRAARERRSLFAESVHIGTLGLLLVIPPVAGAYLGRWLDGMAAGYSMRWTLSLMLLGLVIGAVNVYLNIRE